LENNYLGYYNYSPIYSLKKGDVFLKIVAIIQARMGSTRLKGKALRKIKDKTMIEHIVDRVKKCDKIDQIVVATSLSEENKDLIKLLREKNIEVFLGSEYNVLDRYIRAGQYYRADIVVRVTGDNPLTCPNCIEQMIVSHLKHEAEYTSMEELPLGIGSEIVNLSTLIKILKMNLLDYHREHVTLFIRENKTMFRTNILSAPLELKEPGIRLTVDTKEDFEVITSIYDSLYDKDHIIEVVDALDYLKAKSEILSINKKIVQKRR